MGCGTTEKESSEAVDPMSPRRLLSSQLAVAILVLFSFGISAAEKHHSLQYNDQSVELIISDQFSHSMQGNIHNWGDYISRALLQVYGRLPRENLQIVVSPVSAGSADPIPWAQVHRGDIDKVEFYTAVSASVDELKGAWTSYHELSHLLIPYRGWGDMWFSEGLATYYQNVLQARLGLFSEQEMWQHLYEGFMRGRAQSEFDSIDLQTVSTEMREKGGYMRVYWSGAWYFLTADLRLRQQSGGKRTLDSALEKLNQCCAEQKMSVLQMVKKLDEINKLLLFHPLYLETIATTKSPRFEPLFASMGITVVEERVQIQTVGPGARLRSQISDRKNL